MKISPRKTKYRLKFRNKLKTCKHLKHSRRLADVSHFNSSSIKLASEHYNLATCSFSAASLSGSLRAWVVQYADLRSKNVTNARSNYNGYFKHNEQIAKHYASYNYGSSLLFGNYGFVFENHGKLRAKLIETLRLDIAKALRKKAKVWLRICCDTPVTARPVETRMGKGKGAISYWEAKVTPGQVFFEFSGLNKKRANILLSNVQQKLHIGLKLITYN